jgi:dihydropteroate synthase
MSVLDKNYSLNCGGRLLDLSCPRVMGILNVTPDSFYDGGLFVSEVSILRQAEKMLLEGADVLDIGGMSSRPGAVNIDEGEELGRVLPAVRAVVKHFPGVIVSVDTVKAGVARAAVDCGAGLVNDVSAGGMDVDMFEAVAGLGVPYILMHILGVPESMQVNPRYDDLMVDVVGFLVEKVARLRALGVKDIVVDPGFGFGKSLDDNYVLMSKLGLLGVLDLPILVGVSRKSMVYRLLGGGAEDSLNGTVALNMFALMQGASILRVHDVKAAKDAVAVFNKLRGC